MNQFRRARALPQASNASSYDLTDPDNEPPAPERPPRVGAWLGMSGAILVILAMCMPWTPGKDQMGWSIPMVMVFSPLFFAAAPMLIGAIAIGVVCGRVTRNDPLRIVSARSAEIANTVAILGVAVIGLRSIGLVIDMVRNGPEHTGIGAYIFMIASTLAIVGVFGAIYKRY